MTKSKRLKFTLAAITLNFITFWYAISLGADLSDCGIGLAALNAPLYMYVYGETKRPSKVHQDNEPEV